MRDLAVVQELEDGGGHDGAVGIRLAHDDGGVHDHERVHGVLEELDGAGAVQEGPGLTKEGRAGGAGFQAHLAGLGLGGGITDGVSFLHGAFAGNRLGGEQEAFQQGCLPGRVGTHEGRNARGRWSLRHDLSPCTSSFQHKSHECINTPVFRPRFLMAIENRTGQVSILSADPIFLIHNRRGRGEAGATLEKSRTWL